MALSPFLVSYLDMAKSVADGVGLCPDTDSGAGVTTWTADNQRKISRFLTTAARWAYYPPNTDVRWPGLISGKTITLSSGAFNFSEVDYSLQFSLWNEDPRPINASAYAINVAQSGELFYPATTLGSVYAIYLPRPPEYTNVAWSAGATYALNDLVYYTDERCYRCILVPPVGTVPTNSTYWTPQDCLKILAEAVSLKAAAAWQSMGGSAPASANINAEEAQYELDCAWMRTSKIECETYFNYLASSSIVTASTLAANAGYYTALTGGTATCLDYIVTANGGVTTGTIVETAIGGDAATWQLQAGTTAEDGISIVRPDDYNASTNARIWVRIA